MPKRMQMKAKGEEENMWHCAQTNYICLILFKCSMPNIWFWSVFSMFAILQLLSTDCRAQMCY